MKHIHRYQRKDISRTPGKKYIVYRCTLPDCNHYILPEFLVGKYAICWRCGERFVISAQQATLSRPHCKACTKGYEEKKGSRVVKAKEKEKEKIKVPDFLIPAALR